MPDIRQIEGLRPSYTPMPEKLNQADLSHLYRLPRELVQEILSHTDVYTFLNARCCSTMLHSMATVRPMLVEQLCKVSPFSKPPQAKRENLPDDVEALHKQLMKAAHEEYYVQGEYSETDVSPQEEHYQTVAFTPDSNHLIEVLKSPQLPGDKQGTINLEIRTRDISANQMIHDKHNTWYIKLRFHDLMDSVESVTLSSDGGFLALYFSHCKGSGCLIYNLNNQSPEPLQLDFTANVSDAQEIYQVAFSGDNKMLVTAPEDGLVQVFSLIAPESKPLDLPHECQVWCAVFSADNKLVATGAADGCIRVWSIDKNFCNSSSVVRPVLVPQESLQNIYEEGEGHVEHVAFSADNSSVVAGYEDGTILIWSRPQQASQSTAFTASKWELVCPGGAFLWSVQLNRTDRFVLATSYDGAIRLWDRFAPNNEEPKHLGRSFKQFENRIRQQNSYVFARFSVDNHCIAAVDLDGTLTLWRFGPPKDSMSPPSA